MENVLEIALLEHIDQDKIAYLVMLIAKLAMVDLTLIVIHVTLQEFYSKENVEQIVLMDIIKVMMELAFYVTHHA